MELKVRIRKINVLFKHENLLPLLSLGSKILKFWIKT